MTTLPPSSPPLTETPALTGLPERYALLHSANHFRLECGETLPRLQIAYNTYGTLNASRTNVIWVCHALTANSDVASWWPGLVGSGLPFDTDTYFIVCANILGSCYGSTGPGSLHPHTGQRYGLSFPLVTVRDIVQAHQFLALHLGIAQIEVLVGGSLGGQQALEWAVQQPNYIRKLAVLATNAVHSAWGIAFNSAQRMALLADPTFAHNHPQAGAAGLAAARAIAMLSYRSPAAYGLTQTDPDPNKLTAFRAESYQAYQGHKLVRRYEAHAYHTLSRAMDSHNLARGRADLTQVLAGVRAQTLVVGIDSDGLFPVAEQQFLAQNIPGAQLEVISSNYGHDGFLVETPRIGQLFRQLLTA